MVEFPDLDSAFNFLLVKVGCGVPRAFEFLNRINADWKVGCGG